MREPALFELARASGFPRLQLRPACFVIAGEEAWRRFCAYPTPEDREQATAALAALRVNDAAA
jgi:hypothetical protein